MSPRSYVRRIRPVPGDGPRKSGLWLRTMSAVALLAATSVMTISPETALASECLLDTNDDGSATDGIDTPENSDGAAGSFSNMACGPSADASGVNGNNTAVGAIADANGDGAANTATGVLADASGDLSANSASGFNSDASGESSFNSASGPLANASGNFSNNVASGMQSNASGTASSNIAIGNGATATGNGTSNTAVGANSSATFANSAAFGQGATTSRANQQAFGTAGNTYTMAGIASNDSKTAQGAPTHLVTSNAGGDLAAYTVADLGLASSGDIAAAQTQITGLQSQVGGLQSQINGLGQRDDELANGIAISLALAQPVMLSGQNFAVRGGWGNFDGTNAVGVTAAGVLSRGDFGPTSAIILDGGVGTGTSEGVVAGRAGVTFGW